MKNIGYLIFASIVFSLSVQTNVFAQSGEKALSHPDEAIQIGTSSATEIQTQTNSTEGIDFAAALERVTNRTLGNDATTNTVHEVNTRAELARIGFDANTVRNMSQVQAREAAQMMHREGIREAAQLQRALQPSNNELRLSIQNPVPNILVNSMPTLTRIEGINLGQIHGNLILGQNHSTPIIVVEQRGVWGISRDGEKRPVNGFIGNISNGGSISNGSVSVGNTVVGAGSIVKSESGTITLNGTNTHESSMIIKSGAFNSNAIIDASYLLLSDDTFNKGDLILNGGTSQTAGMNETRHTLTLTADSVINLGDTENTLILNAANTMHGTRLQIYNWSGNSITWNGSSDNVLQLNGGSLNPEIIEFYTDNGETILTENNTPPMADAIAGENPVRPDFGDAIVLNVGALNELAAGAYYFGDTLINIDSTFSGEVTEDGTLSFSTDGNIDIKHYGEESLRLGSLVINGNDKQINIDAKNFIFDEAELDAGTNGTVILDPKNITITNGGSVTVISNGTNGGTLTNGGTISIVDNGGNSGVVLLNSFRIDDGSLLWKFYAHGANFSKNETIDKNYNALLYSYAQPYQPVDKSNLVDGVEIVDTTERLSAATEENGAHVSYVNADTDVTIDHDIQFKNENANAQNTHNAIFIGTNGELDLKEGTSIRNEGRVLALASGRSIEYVNVSLESSGAVMLGGLEDVTIRGGRFSASEEIFVYARNMLDVDGLEFGNAPSDIFMEAITIKLRNIDFPEGSRVDLASQYGGLSAADATNPMPTAVSSTTHDGRYPYFGDYVPGRVNFIHNVTYGGKDVNSLEGFDANGEKINIHAKR